MPQPTTDRAAWTASVTANLRGRSLDDLNSITEDGVCIAPLYTAEDLGDLDPGVPGATPFLRGSDAIGATADSWDARVVIDAPSPAQARTHIHQATTSGATSVLLEIGRGRLAVRNAADLGEVLADVDLASTPIHLRADDHALPLAAALLQLAQDRGQLGLLRGTLGLDPLGALARTGQLDLPLEEALGWLPEVIGYCNRFTRNIKALCVDTSAYHGAGVTDAWELAIALSAGVEYLVACESRGLIPDLTARQLLLSIRLGPRPFESIAKVRALRLIWGRVLEACGARAPIAVHVRSSERDLTATDPWVNLLRGTAVCFAGALAGADAITVAPLDAALGTPSDLGRRAARLTQSVLRHEAHLGRVLDPAGGSYFLESLTDALAVQAWAHFQTIEGAGGLGKALRGGVLASLADRSHNERAARVATGRRPLVGTSIFPQLGERLPTPGTRDAAPTDAPADGDPAAHDALLDAVDAYWSDEPPDPGVALRALMAASATWPFATLSACLAPEGESVTPLPLRRVSAPFEKLRALGDAAGHPAVFLACLGPLAERSARTDWLHSALAAGGLRALGEPADPLASQSASQLADAFRTSGATIALVCGSDARYANEAAPAVAALAQAGAKQVWIAGKPRELPHLHGALYVGCDLVAALHDLWSAVEAK